MSIETSKLESLAADIAAGRPADPETRKKALESLRELRESIRKKIGTVDLVVPTLRSIREE